MLTRLLLITSLLTTSIQATSAIELQKQADQVREEGKSLLAIDLYNQAIVGFQESKDYASIMGALTGRLLSWKHLFYKTDDKLYALFVKKEAETMMELVKEYNLGRLHLIHFLNGTSAILLKDYTTAENEFRQAIDLYPSEHAEKGDWLAHLGDAQYRNGKKEQGKKAILEGVKIIKERASQIDSFVLNVWVSGAYLRLAKLLKTDEPKESHQYLIQAKEIIDSDSRLVIRKQQLDAYLKEVK